jgi:hypothetical protein
MEELTGKELRQYKTEEFATRSDNETGGNSVNADDSSAGNHLPNEVMYINGSKIQLFYAKESDLKPMYEIQQILLNDCTL